MILNWHYNDINNELKLQPIKADGLKILIYKMHNGDVLICGNKLSL